MMLIIYIVYKKNYILWHFAKKKVLNVKATVMPKLS